MKPFHRPNVPNSAALLTLAATVFLGVISEGTVSAGTGLNGTDARPFYNFAHNPNTLGDVVTALNAGANALEPDITTSDDCNILVDWDSSFPSRSGDCGDTHLTDWLDGVHTLAGQYPQLALVVFDVKSPAATPAYGSQILQAIRDHLNHDGVALNVIISVATKDDLGLFDNILPLLGDREGVQVDSEDDAGAVVQYFFDRGYFQNIGFGDGTAAQGPNLPRAIDAAAGLRASVGYPKIVTYVYTLSLETSMHFFIDAGVDGIIPTTGSQSELAGVVNAHPEIRLGTRDDNPFQPANEAYALQIRTLDETGGGTDADLTFTLIGCRGTATITVNTGFVEDPLYNSHRMEPGNTDWVTLPSLNLGRLTAIQVYNDGSGLFPNWHLQDIRVSSAHWISPNFGHVFEYEGNFNGEIGDGDTATISLVPNFADPKPTIQCPPAITQPNDLDQCGAVVTFSPKVDSLCLDAVAICSPAAGTFFQVGTATVTCHAHSPSSGDSDPCTFTVTVSDTQLPVITCPVDITVPNDPGKCSAVVNYTVKAVDNCPGLSVVCTMPSGSAFPKGTTLVKCTATDMGNNSVSCSFNVTVNDTEPPVVKASVALASLSPKFHDLINVGLKVTAVDNCPGALPLTVKVFGNEDDETPTADGVFSPDAKALAPGTLRLRGECKGNGKGRVYLIVSSTVDTSGNFGFTSSTVVVPHSTSAADVAAVKALATIAQAYCQAHNGTAPVGYFVIGDGALIGPKQ